jgi:hypothetical protein
MGNEPIRHASPFARTSPFANTAVSFCSHRDTRIEAAAAASRRRKRGRSVHCFGACALPAKRCPRHTRTGGGVRLRGLHLRACPDRPGWLDPGSRGRSSRLGILPPRGRADSNPGPCNLLDHGEKCRKVLRSNLPCTRSEQQGEYWEKVFFRVVFLAMGSPPSWMNPTPRSSPRGSPLSA